jgi:hypothetical protein
MPQGSHVSGLLGKVHYKSWMSGSSCGNNFAIIRPDMVTHEINRPDVLDNLLVHEHIPLAACYCSTLHFYAASY